MLVPLMPYFKAICPGPMLEIIMGIRKGEILLGPDFSSFSLKSSMVFRPPMPTPMMVAMERSFSGVTLYPESSISMVPVAAASCVKRSMWRASLADTYLVGSKSFTSPATLEAYSVESKRVIGPRPDSPATRRSHVVAMSWPRGVRAARPVITTRGRAIMPP